MLNGSMIIEKITNSSGTAIKYEDGTMIQCGTILFENFAITDRYGLTGSNDYFGTVTLSFPEKFVGINSIVVTINSPRHLVNFSGNSRSNEAFSGFVFASTELTIGFEVQFIAIGRWK